MGFAIDHWNALKMRGFMRVCMKNAGVYVLTWKIR
jgi:hypothetical protein